MMDDDLQMASDGVTAARCHGSSCTDFLRTSACSTLYAWTPAAAVVGCASLLMQLSGTLIYMSRVRTLVDAVVGHDDLQADLQRSPPQVLQLLDGLFAHVLQLADVVVHVGDLHLASCPRPPGSHLPAPNFKEWMSLLDGHLAHQLADVIIHFGNVHLVHVRLVATCSQGLPIVCSTGQLDSKVQATAQPCQAVKQHDSGDELVQA